MAAQQIQLLRNLCLGFLAERYQIHIERLDRSCLDLLMLQNQENPFEPDAKADARLVRSADLGDQAVVPSASADGVNGPDASRLVFKGRVRVIVEPANKAGIDRIINAHRFQVASHLGEVLGAFLVQAVQNGRRVRELVLIDLAVQHAQRVALHAALAVAAQAVLHRTQEAEQLLAVSRAARNIADRIDLHPDALQTEVLAELVTEGDDLRVDRWINSAECLNPELVELAVPARLWTLITEHRSNIVQLTDIWLPVQLVLHIGPDNAGRSFRTQRQIPAALVLEVVHFAFHDIGRFANAALEQLCMLKHRSANFAVIEAPAQISGLFFNELPSLHRTGQEILRSGRLLDSLFSQLMIPPEHALGRFANLH
ncbi:hypothetical protein D3C81_914350 [compost metagenome]